MMSFNFYGGGLAEEPLTTDNYKRAVFCAPPPRFSVEFLAPAKQRGAYSLGMRICPMSLGDLDSIASKGSLSEYDIWRRWEDCLWFQDTLESEYKRAAREKRQRLLQGKGVKSFNGMYKQDMASSWESLPPGPDPNSVAREIHQHIPYLTKKDTFFRASLATVEMRQREFEGLIEALFRDDMPALIKEIRSSRIVTDFFGFWRRDYDLAERNRKAGQPRSSVTSIVFSMYFSDSDKNSSSRSLPSSPVKEPRRTSEQKDRPRPAVSETPEDCGYSSRRWNPENTDASTISLVSSRRRAVSNSSDSSSSQSDTSSYCSSISSTLTLADDPPFVFGHNPVQAPDATFSVRPLLAPLLEEQELEKWCLEDYKTAYLRRRKNSTGDRASNRHCSIFKAPPKGPEFARKSQPSPTEENPPVDSPRPSAAQPFVKPKPRISFPVSLSGYETWSESEEDDPCFSDHVDSRPETPLGRRNSNNLPEATESLPSFSVCEIPSPTASTFSVVSSATTHFSATTDFSLSSVTTSGSLSIKAAYNNSIIMLRVPHDIPFSDLRQRLYNKFVDQEGVPLSPRFVVASMPPKALTAHYSASVPCAANEAHMELIDCQSEWEQLASSIDGSKLTLRILDGLP